MTVRKWARRLGMMGAAAIAAATIAPPAHASTNPYTGAEACHNEFGGSWSYSSDGHRQAKTDGGSVWGDVYLLYNSATGYNCVATIKSAYVGTSTGTTANLLVDDGTWKNHSDADLYRYYAAVQWYGRGKCVQYWGTIWDPTATYLAEGSRDYWGNCS
ncbi:hypothetical protein GCM10009527_021500 [Actinomadura nitritigenes]|uniref:Spore-associated protein A n=1 Tax=Actinomadura nitritigenes TaxID=134602 RepID=A0ABS3QVG9_9ACTN|nr:hypothetical protein [Actinomadura nitritigenes]MBO2437982.1 hypothetical protein [Actinomadura nitritigenes]